MEASRTLRGLLFFAKETRAIMRERQHNIGVYEEGFIMTVVIDKEGWVVTVKK